MVLKMYKNSLCINPTSYLYGPLKKLSVYYHQKCISIITQYSQKLGILRFSNRKVLVFTYRKIKTLESISRTF